MGRDGRVGPTLVSVVARALAAALIIVSVIVAMLVAVPSIGQLSLRGATPPPKPTAIEGVAWEPSEWDGEVAPNYWREAGRAIVGDEPAAGTVELLPLDAWGRARGACATVTAASMEAGIARDRDDISELTPSGWGDNAQVDIALPDGDTYHGYLWNRSHLVAKSLGGPDVLENIVCGTRMQNVGANDGRGGMAYPERLCRDWLEANPQGSVYYRATPVYVGHEPVCRSVFVDVRSSDGTLDMRLEVYNAAAGFAIDYATGAFAVEGEGVPVTSEGQTATEADRMVVVTGTGHAYHHDRTCPGLANANVENLREVTLSEAEASGRHACAICGG